MNGTVRGERCVASGARELRGARMYLCVRGVEYVGTSLRAVRLWERQVDLGRGD